MTDEGKIPFPFAPIPRQVFAAHRAGGLTLTEFRVLEALYERWTRGNDLVVYVHNLDSLGRSIRWEGEPETLSKVLRSLRAKDWVAFKSQPGRKHHPYDIRLLLPERSEHDPSSQTDNHAESDDPAVTPDPSRGPLDPSSEQAASPHRNGDSAAAESDPVRAPLDLSRRTTSQSEEQVGPARAREDDPDEEEFFDQLWRETASTRGAYSEPGS